MIEPVDQDEYGLIFVHGGGGSVLAYAELAGLPSADLAQLIQDLTEQMKAAATELQFELAARLRDEIGDLKKELRQMLEATK